MTSKDDIKQAALHLFAVKGFECTSMQDIAQAVGLKKQSLYSHFAGKQELYELILGEQAKIITSELQLSIDRLENEPAEMLFKGIFKCMIDLFSHKDRLMLWKRGFMIYDPNETSAIAARAEGHFSSMIWDRLYNIIGAKHNQLSNPECFRLFFLSYLLSIQGYLDWMIAIGHSEDIFEAFWKNIWNGIYQSVI